MRKEVLFLIGLVFAGILASSGRAEEAKKEAGFLPFKLNEFLDVSSGTDTVRIEDLKVTAGQDTFLGKMPVMAKVNIKNLTEKKLQLSIYLVLFDEKKNLIAAGNYSSVSGMGGFGPRETSTETISLGYASDLSRAKLYQYRVVTFSE